MKKLIGIVAFLSLAAPVFPHRLDEYLQAIIVSVGQGHIGASMRLIPGVAVSAAVIASVDANSDGILSQAEQEAYAQKVLRNLSLTVDGRTLQPRLAGVSFPAPEDMKEGTGEIHIEFAADLPSGGSHRTLIIENHHAPHMSVYLMNCLAPRDHGIQIVSQNRSQNQSYYRVDYANSGAEQDSFVARWRSAVLTEMAGFVGVPSMFRLGMRHIAEGTDHLLSLIALLLPAPLLAVQSHWTAFGGARHSLVQILRVVTGFTLGHSTTLALGAFGLISLPERPVEVLIAVSILISAAHALRPLFPGREPFVAAMFGLIHGLAFATTLQNLGVGLWQRTASILGFNLGIETMQLVVVATLLPSLIILSRTPAYTCFGSIGALFAGLASLGWIVERSFGVPDFVNVVVDRVAQSGTRIAASLLIVSVVAWLHYDRPDRRDIIARKPALGESEPAVS